MLPPSNPTDHTRSPYSERKRSDGDHIKYPQVLLAVRLESDGFDQDAWLEWLRIAPAECKDINFDSRYDSFSTLLLLRMSTATWNVLPNNPACSFIGFVTSENKSSTPDISNREKLWDGYHAEYPDYYCPGFDEWKVETRSVWGGTRTGSPSICAQVESDIATHEAALSGNSSTWTPRLGEAVIYNTLSSENIPGEAPSSYTSAGTGKS